MNKLNVVHKYQVQGYVLNELNTVNPKDIDFKCFLIKLRPIF